MVCSSVQSNDNPNTCFIFNFAETTQLKIDTCHCIEKPLEGLWPLSTGWGVADMGVGVTESYPINGGG